MRHVVQVVEWTKARGRSGLRVPFAALVLLLALASGAEGTELPMDRQVPILFKLLTYDRALEGSLADTLRVGLYHVPSEKDSRAQLEELEATLSALGDKTIAGRSFRAYPVAAAPKEVLRSVLTGLDIDVLYVLAGSAEELGPMLDLSRDLDILTLAGDQELVGQGISIGLSLEQNRPTILIDLDALRAEGHEFGSNVLRLCRIVQGEGAR